MQRHQRRTSNSSSLNLVSLMDIFTILVFFLMVNSSDVKVLQQDKSVVLPSSTTEQQPKDTIIITISGSNILVQGRAVARIDSPLDIEIIKDLKVELDYLANRRAVSADIEFKGFPITLIADKSTPYKLLKKVMATCTEAKYTQVSLAVSKTLKPKADA
ncbi:MAG: biopolymer transport protein ExbD [Oleiphilaceae bacterium]|jgi:biopolymer transport protein ExbD